MASSPTSATITKPKKKRAFMLPELSENAANTVYLWGYILFVASAVVGVLSAIALFWGDKVKEMYAERRMVKSEERIADANNEAARAAENAALANVRAAGLEKEAAEARLELARIDPLNVPITSVKAEVYLELKGPIIETFNLIGQPPFRTSVFTILGEPNKQGENFLFSADCIDFETKQSNIIRDHIGPIPEMPKFIPNCRIISASYAWPNNANSLEQHLSKRIEKLSARDLDKVMAKARVSLMSHDLAGAEIVKASCIVTINGSLQRRFESPSITGWKVEFLPPKKQE